MRTSRMALGVALAVLTTAGCEESFDDAAGAGGAGSVGATGAGPGVGAGDAALATGVGGGLADEGRAIDVPVPAQGRVHVDLDEVAIVGADDGWDLAFEGLDVFTNGGLSGPGVGAAFGPYVVTQFLFDERPEVPFLIEDHAGGAFVDWYLYDGTSHALWSRYHVVGLRRGAARYKVQILGYYGEIEGAPVSAVYQVRHAEVTADGVGATVVVDDLDGTAGGTSPGDDDPSGCLVLATGERLALTPAEAQASDAWDLCFRRDVITVNGERGGPGGVVAVNLDAASTEGETLEEVRARTPVSEEARFDDVDPARLDDPALVWRGDRVISAFSDAWLREAGGVLAPAPATWLVVGADGAEHLVAVEELLDATADAVGTVRLRTKPLRP